MKELMRVQGHVTVRSHSRTYRYSRRTYRRGTVRHDGKNTVQASGLTHLLNMMLATPADEVRFPRRYGLTQIALLDTTSAEVVKADLTDQYIDGTSLVLVLYVPTTRPATQPVNINAARLYADSGGLTLFASINLTPFSKTTSLAYTVEWVIDLAAGTPASPAQTVISYTTGTLADGATENAVVALGAAGTVFQVQTLHAARVRVYTSAVARAADASRPFTTPPTDPHGVCLDVRPGVAPAGLTVALSPIAPYANLESTPSDNIPVAITNLSGASRPITVVFTVEA